MGLSLWLLVKCLGTVAVSSPTFSRDKERCWAAAHQVTIPCRRGGSTHWTQAPSHRGKMHDKGSNQEVGSTEIKRHTWQHGRKRRRILLVVDGRDCSTWPGQARAHCWLQPNWSPSLRFMKHWAPGPLKWEARLSWIVFSGAFSPFLFQHAFPLSWSSSWVSAAQITPGEHHLSWQEQLKASWGGSCLWVPALLGGFSWWPAAPFPLLNFQPSIPDAISIPTSTELESGWTKVKHESIILLIPCFAYSLASVSPSLGIEAGPHHRHPRCWITCLLWLPAPQHPFPKGTCMSKVPTGSICVWSESGINCSRNAFGRGPLHFDKVSWGHGLFISLSCSPL